jgi:putative methyltransferase (TIGR04325 family)
MTESTGFAPIALFAYNRPAHLVAVAEALARNPEAAQSRLFVFSDAPKHEAASGGVEEVRARARALRGFRSVEVVEAPANLGVAKSIIGGAGRLTAEFGRVIVLEDDLRPSPHFLCYMNDALRAYAEDERVISIHAYSYPVGERLPDTFFLRGADCWGWGTWKRGWDLFEADGRKLLAELERRELTREFDFDGSYPYTQMLRDCIAGANDSWAVRWYASAFLLGKLTLYPGSAQVQNIGADGSGTHVESTRRFENPDWGRPLPVGGIPVEESLPARRAFARFLAGLQPSMASRSLNGLRRLLPRPVKRAIRDFTPPIFFRLIGPRRRQGLRFQGDYAGWSEASKASGGYDQDQILRRVFDAEMRVKRGEAADARDGVTFDAVQFSLPVMAGLLRAAAGKQGPLKVLDFGGAFGGLYRQYKALGLPATVDWAVVEQRAYAKLGAANFQNHELRFFETLEDALQPETDVILVSSSLQYLPDPYAFLARILASNADHVLLDRIPCTNLRRDALTVQTVPPEIYPASYPCWLLSRERLLQAFAPRYRMLTSFTDGSGCWSSDVADFEWAGFIFDQTRRQ